MKIVFLDWNCFNKEDTMEALASMGHSVIRYIDTGYNDIQNKEFLDNCRKMLEREHPQMFFSYNYFPLVAEACHLAEIPYISFVYDSPYTYVYSYTLMYPTNYVFLFDRSWVEEFNSGGLKNVYYMVLPGNVNKVRNLEKRGYDMNRTVCDISFVGTLYNEEHNFYDRLIEKAPEYLQGYLSGLIEAQQKLYGMNIVDSALERDSIYDMLIKTLPIEDTSRGIEPKVYRYSNYFVKRKITQLERQNLLTILGAGFGNRWDIKLFTVDLKYNLKGIKNMGVTGYETEMPLVFKNSKINLNISLRSINTGIPLRCIDILSSGGFLLSNYQGDLATDFIPGEDFDYFGSPEEMLSKCEYYLSHEKERLEIALNGQRKIEKYYSFEAVFGRIFNLVFGE